MKCNSILDAIGGTPLVRLNRVTKDVAAEMYVKEGGNVDQVDKILKMMEDPQVSYTLTPERVLPFAQFMSQVGTLKNRPSSWKDLFFPEIYDLPGS